MSESQEGAETAVGSPVLEGAETAAEESPAQEDAEIAADSTLEDDDEDETFEDEPEQPDLDTAEMARMRAEMLLRLADEQMSPAPKGQPQQGDEFQEISDALASASKAASQSAQKAAESAQKAAASAQKIGASIKEELSEEFSDASSYIKLALMRAQDGLKKATDRVASNIEAMERKSATDKMEGLNLAPRGEGGGPAVPPPNLEDLTQEAGLAIKSAMERAKEKLRVAQGSMAASMERMERNAADRLDQIKAELQGSAGDSDQDAIDAKYIEDLDIVSDQISLCRTMLDNPMPNSEEGGGGEDDALLHVVSFLQACVPRISEMIEQGADSESNEFTLGPGAMEMAIAVNFNLTKTLDECERSERVETALAGDIGGGGEISE